MNEEKNKAIFRQFYERAWNMNDVAVVDELLAANFVNHEVVDATLSHRELYKQAIIETRAAFPDWTITVDDLIAEGDKVVARCRGRGTHTGIAWEKSPTGKQINIIAITIVKVVEGKITDFWKQDNSLLAWQQLETTAQ